MLDLGLPGHSRHVQQHPNRAGILFSPFVTPDLTAAARAFVPPSRCEWRIPRDTLPPMADLREDFSLLLGRSFLSLLELLLPLELNRFKEDTEVEGVEEDAVESVALVRLDRSTALDSSDSL